MKIREKRRYRQPGYPSIEQALYARRNFHHVLNLFEAYRWEPARIVRTDRYREWLAKRDAVEVSR